MFELAATTEPGARLVRLAETLAADFATRAAVHDRDASYPHASVDALRDSGYLAAAVPAEHGGMGVASVHDLIVAASRLARGDASVAIGANMHMAVLRNVLRRWEMAVAAGKDRRAAAFAATLDDIARGGTVIATAISEHGLQDLTRPATTARRTLDGWRIDGRKAFCTMAPAATVLFTAVSFVDDDGRERYGYARVPAGTPGVVVHDDWDALGMRGSRSAARATTWRATCPPACSTRRRRSGSPRPPSRRRSEPRPSTAAGGCWWPRTRSSCPPPARR